MDTLKMGQNWPMTTQSGASPKTQNQQDWFSVGPPPQASKRTTLAYRALVLFSFVYFVRPEDFVPGLSYLYLARVLGGITLLALVFGVKRSEHHLWPQPTRDPAEAVVIAPHYKTAPRNPPIKVSRSWDS